MKKFQNKVYSIRNVMLLSFGIFIVFPLVAVVSIIGYRMAAQSVTDSISSHEIIVKNAADKANLIFEDITYMSTSPVINRNFQNIVSYLNNNQNSYSWNNMREELEEYIKSIRNSSLYSINGEIAILTKNNYLIESDNYYETEIDYDKNWIKQLYAEKLFYIWDRDVADIFIDPIDYSPSENDICFARSVKNYKEVVGIMAIRLSGGAFWDKVCEKEQIMQNDDSYCFFICKSNGSIMTKANIPSYSPSENDIQEVRSIVQSSTFKNKNGFLENGYYYISPIKSIDGYIVCIVDKNTILKDSNKIKNTVSIELILIILSSIILLLVISYYVSKPLQKLSKEIENDGGQLLLANENRSSIAEVRNIAVSYNKAIAYIKKLIENIEKEIEQKESAKYIALQSQITPHFLYNTLNTFKLMLQNDRDTYKVIKGMTSLENLLRHTYHSQGEMTTLEDELEFIDNYVEIMQLRYGATFTYCNIVSADLLDCKIPRVTIQPLVENAIIHGVRDITSGQIIVSAIKNEENVAITVFNSGKAINKEEIRKIFDKPVNKGQKITSIGINNVDQRLKMLFGDNYGVSINENMISGFEITIVIPYSE